MNILLVRLMTRIQRTVHPKVPATGHLDIHFLELLIAFSNYFIAVLYRARIFYYFVQ